MTIPEAIGFAAAGSRFGNNESASLHLTGNVIPNLRTPVALNLRLGNLGSYNRRPHLSLPFLSLGRRRGGGTMSRPDPLYQLWAFAIVGLVIVGQYFARRRHFPGVLRSHWMKKSLMTFALVFAVAGLAVAQQPSAPQGAAGQAQP